MPEFNRKGPHGEGPGTGKRLGKCYANQTMHNEQNEEMPIRENNRTGGLTERPFGRGLGCRNGFGRRRQQRNSSN